MAVYAVIALAFLFFLSCLLRGSINRSKVKYNSFDDVLILDSYILKAGILGFVIFAFAATAACVVNESAWLVLLFSVFMFLGMLLIVAWCNCRIYYNSEIFIVKNLLGSIYRYTYHDVTTIRYTILGDVIVYADRRIALIDVAHVGNKKFVKRLKRKYAEFHHEQMPSRTNTKKSISR